MADSFSKATGPSGAFAVRLESLSDGTPVFHVVGDVDLRTSPQLRESLLNSMPASPRRVVVDLSQVPYMDSSGVGTIVEFKRRVDRAGGRVVLAGLQERVRSVLEITRLDRFFTIVGSVEEAAKA